MLAKFEVSGVHVSIEPDLHKHVNKKLGGLDKYVPRRVRKSAHAEVHLKEVKDKGNSFSCEVTLYLPHQTIIVKEKAKNLYAAVDIAETKLKLQLKKYKDLHTSSKRQRHIIARFLR